MVWTDMRLWLVLVFFGCNSGPAALRPCTSDAECTAPMVCDLDYQVCRAPADATVVSVELTMIYTPDRARAPSGLTFNKLIPDQVWIANHLDDTVVIVHHAGTAQQSAQRLKDPAAEHFMHRPTGIAWGAGNTWATCGEGDNGGNDFMGPALFSGDLTIFAKPTAGGLGSHLDMLHDSPWCMGIAHETSNVYWVFDGQHSSLSRYDFKMDHGPGNDDHSDGVILRYVEGQVRRVPDVPSHLFYRAEDALLYAADTGGARIVALDTKSGTRGPTLPTLEPSVPVRMDNATLNVVVAPGTLQAPSGLVVAGTTLYVTDHATSRIHAFDLTGKPLKAWQTTLAPKSLAGIAVGPEGELWLSDYQTGIVYKTPKLL